MNFLGALATGYSAEQIIEFIVNNFPNLGKRIKEAKQIGHDVSTLAKKFQGLTVDQFKDLDEQAYKETSKSPYLSAQNKRKEQTAYEELKKIAPKIAGAASIGLSAYGLYKSFPNIIQSLPKFPTSPQSPNPNIPQSNNQIGQNIGFPGQQGSTPQPGPNIPQIMSNQPETAQPIEPSPQSNIPQSKNNITESIPELKALQQKEKDIEELWKVAHGERGIEKPEDKDFLRYAKKLLKNGDLKDFDTFKEFKKWWGATEGKQRTNPMLEFEKFRFQTKGMNQQVIHRNAENTDTSLQPIEQPKEALNVPGIQIHEKRNEQIFPETAKPEEIKKPAEAKQEREIPKLILEKGQLRPIEEKTHEAAFGKEERPIQGKQKPLKDMTYEEVYRDSSQEDRMAFKRIDNAIQKTAKHLAEGKDFIGILKEKGIPVKVQMSTADDVLRHLAGVPSKYNLLDEKEKEDTFNTFTGLTPNLTWNAILAEDPSLEKLYKNVKSPKGPKKGKDTYDPADFRRMLNHGVTKFFEAHKTFGEKAKYIVPVVNMVEIFKERKKDMQQKLSQELQEMSDEDFNNLLDQVDESLIRKIR